MALNVTIVEFPAKRLIGMKVATNMQKAGIDCPSLWQAFGPRMAELPGYFNSRGYGVSVMNGNEGEFDYWAALESGIGTIPPKGLETISISAGLYASCTVANPAMVSGAYAEIYGDWAGSERAYAIDWRLPCFELYASDWRIIDPLNIFVPVVRK